MTSKCELQDPAGLSHFLIFPSWIPLLSFNSNNSHWYRTLNFKKKSAIIKVIFWKTRLPVLRKQSLTQKPGFIEDESCIECVFVFVPKWIQKALSKSSKSRKVQVTSAVLLQQNGSSIRNSASLLRFSRGAVKHPLSKGLAKALSKRAGFPLCLCCELGRGIHQPLLT